MRFNLPAIAATRPDLRTRWGSLVRLALGLLLVAAAGLKLKAVGFSSIPQVGYFSTPAVQIAVAEWELVLGIWLLSGRHRSGAWLMALVTFLALAAISFYLGWRGVASSGRLGARATNPCDA